MNKTIIQFEYKYWLLHPVTGLLFTVWIAVLFFTVHDVSNFLNERRKHTEELVKEQNERFVKHIPLMDSFATGKRTATVFWDDARNAYDIGYVYGRRYLIKKVLPLAPLSIGQSNLHHGINTINTSPDSWFMALKKAQKLSNPHNSIFGDFDVASAITLLLPLLIIAFNFSILSSEKEDGRLSILLAQGISVKTFLRSKIVFRYLVTTLLSWSTVVVAFFLLGFNFFSDMRGCIAFTSVLFLYSALWHLACMLVNLFRKSSDFNAGILFTAWIAWVLVIPAISTAVVSVVKPIPGKVKLIDEMRETLTDYDKKNSQILDQFYTDHPQFVIKDSSKMMPQFMYKYMIKYMNTLHTLTPLMNDYKGRAVEQSKAATYVSILSPAMLFQDVADEVSGHSQIQFLLFQQYADSVNLQCNNYFNPLSLANRYLTVEEFKKLPTPVYNISINDRKLAGLIMGLLAWLLLLAFLVTRRIKSYKFIQ
ncbi:MAG: DUF3526 domain-containing protein [Chitinophagaceae bacterium]|nr:DUF3526 domain-containing protein [Chitinophagaceae bacterium]